MEIFGDNLVLIEKIAAGGMGEVYLAKLLGKAGFEKTVAVKRIHPRVAEDKEIKALFESEVKLSAVLQHPNIIQAFGNGEINGYLYLIMEFIDGCTLLQLLKKLRAKKEKLPTHIALLIMAQVCEGLSYAHDLKDENTGNPLNLIHRDLSPDNIMLTYSGIAKIVDFGIVKTTETQHTRTGTIKGKISYMSPEQARGEVLDKRSDLFSLFVIIWECFANEKLFNGKNEYELFKALEESKIPQLKDKIPSIDTALSDFVHKGLTRQIDARYQSCSDVLKEIKNYLALNYPNSDKETLSNYLKNHFAEEINERRNHWEKIRPEAEKFISSARIQIDSRLLPKKQIIEKMIGKELSETATIIANLKTDSKSSPYHSHVEIKKNPPGYGGIIALLVVAVSAGFYFTKSEDNSRHLAGQNIDTLVLPDIQQSSTLSLVKSIESTGAKRFVLSETSSVWKYWDYDSMPDERWMMPNYNDNSWKKGKAPLGYGDPVATNISYGDNPNDKIPTAYFRKEFYVEEKSRFTDVLLLGLRRDDAAVVYLNGKKVYSDPLTAIGTHKSYALKNRENEHIFEYMTLSTSMLETGKNYFAIEVHQHVPKSSDLVMEAFLTTWVK